MSKKQTLLQQIKSNSLTEVCLYKYNISEAKTLPIIEALINNVSVTELYLRGSRIGYQGALVIAEVLKTNHSKRIIQCKKLPFAVATLRIKEP